MSPAPALEEIRRAAREVLGHRTLLPGQAEAVRSAVTGRDTLALLPTGGGKSAIYQLAGLERPGATIVVSPLLALQQDQLDGLHELGLPGAALNSTVADGAREEMLSALEAGELEFLLLSPEQLARPDVLERIAAAEPSLFVIDEAHCVSEWGHDFRPEYRRLGATREQLGAPPILALTATASPPVRDDIVRWLGLRDPLVVARGFDRPEIFLEVSRFPDGARKRDSLLTWVAETTPPGIVYTATRRAATELATALRERGVRADPYHAGLGDRRRRELLDAFMSDRIDVVVATVAFGMGVDKSNVRFVAHHDPSDSLDAYHQEIGRAGRDGEPAGAHLFFDPADLGLRRFQTIPPPITEDQARRIVRALRDGAGSTAELPRRVRVGRRRADHVVAALESLDAVRVEADGTATALDRLADATLPANVAAEQERRRRHARSRVELLRGYAETDGCRRRYLLNTLGEELDAPCGHCDNCVQGRSASTAADESPADGAFAINDAVLHSTFGRGSVARVEGDRLVVRFDSVGYRTLALDTVLEDGLLRSVE